MCSTLLALVLSALLKLLHLSKPLHYNIITLFYYFTFKTARVSSWMDVCVDGRVDGRVDGCVDGCLGS